MTNFQAVSTQTEPPIEVVALEARWRLCAPKRMKGEPPQDWNKRQVKAFTHFCSNYWHIKHPELGRIKFEMFDAQIETVECWINERYVIILKARQIGFSTLVAAYAFWLAYFHPDRTIIMLSRTERDAIKLLGKAKYGARFLPEWMVERPGSPLMNETQTKIEFTNESIIESLPSASNPARGESTYLTVVDELAFLPNSEEAYNAIEPTADVGGRIIMLSTANGEGNLFHRLWVEATAGNNRFKTLFFPWWANGRDQDWYEAKKNDLLEHQLAQEYPDNPDEAFLKSGNPVFSLDALRKIETSAPKWRGYLKTDSKVPTFASGWDHLSQDPLRVWEMPDKEGKYVIGADTAQGLEHGDYSSAHVINVRNHEVVAHWHGRIDPDLFGEVLYWLGLWYNNALVGPENNNHGLTTCKTLSQMGYHPIYQARSPKYRKSVPTDVLGWPTTQVTKPLMVDELNKALRGGEMILHDEETIAELRTYVRDSNGKMSGSPYDDRVMSLAIANQMLKYVWMPEFAPDDQPGPGTIGYMEKLLFGELGNSGKKREERQPIGANYVRSR